MGRPLADTPSIPSWRQLPCLYDDLVPRLSVDCIGGDEMCAYMSQEGEKGEGETFVDIKLRLTGFVNAVNLSVTGDWRG